MADAGMRDQAAEALLESFRKRLAAVRKLWDAAAADLTVE